jgi:DNA-binding transcriptional MerR regulator
MTLEFRTPQVAKVTGVNEKTLHYWDQTGFLTPSIARSKGTGTKRIYSFMDLVALRVAHELRGTGVSLQALRRVVRYLTRHKELAHPLAETYLVTDGKDVYAKTGDALMSVLRQPGQGLLFHVVDLSRTVGEVRAAVVQLPSLAGTHQARASG